MGGKTCPEMKFTEKVKWTANFKKMQATILKETFSN